jgi:predicted TIM-barrel fold metal-dependent hydrolase
LIKLFFTYIFFVILINNVKAENNIIIKKNISLTNSSIDRLKIRKSNKQVKQSLSASISSRKVAPYDGKLIDAIAQWRNSNKTWEEIMKRAKKADISQIGIFYRKTSNNLDNLNQNIVMLEKSQDKLFPFLFLGTPKFLKNNSGLSKDRVELLLQSIKRKKYHFVSEIMLKHASKLGRNEALHEYKIRLDDELLDYLINNINVIAPKIPIQIHYEIYNSKIDLPLLDNFLSKYTKTHFILTHMGYTSPKNIEILLQKHPNLYVTISKRISAFNTVAEVDNAKEISLPILNGDDEFNPFWKDFLIKYSNRIMFGTDANYDYLWQQYPRIIRLGRIMLGMLPRDVSENIAYKNSQLVYHLK